MSDLRAYVINDGSVIITSDESPLLVAEFIICDDCREAYLAPAYYQFDPEGCTIDDEGTLHDSTELCTGNMCPSCAGPYLEPDDEHDPRRPPS